MDMWDLLQWPAMVVNIYAAWLVTGTARRRRQMGFGWFLVSNVLWTAWGIVVSAYAVIVLQVFLAIMNVVGMRKNSSSS